jgi:hypothetical protein
MIGSNTMKNRGIVSLIAIALLTHWSHAQEAALPAGGEASGTGGTVSYSIGQVNYTYQESVTGNLSQGVQHAYEVYTVGVVATTLHISLRVYPNPTTDYLTLEIPEFAEQDLTVQLFDASGKLVWEEPVQSSHTVFDLTGLPASTFIFYVMEKNERIQTFKIIKSH